ncbi:MAG TPA: FtsX-like permease family protein, partial [Longimicrobiales bacterium]|nr:FtsX-like permease family protein [Longimicrobiales bacterium]
PDPGAIREAIWSVDPEVPVPAVTPMASLVDSSLSRERFSATVLLAFGAAALLIALQGIYGVLSYVVAIRRRELGIRIALGARRGDVVALVLWRAAGLTGTGLILGAGAAFGLTRLLGSLLYGVAATEVASFLGAGACLLVTALTAAWIPAVRAARGDATTALRAE